MVTLLGTLRVMLLSNVVKSITLYREVFLGQTCTYV